jgi:hypothetical protein
MQDCRLTVYEGKAHGIYMTEARRVCDDISHFVAETCAASR